MEQTDGDRWNREMKTNSNIYMYIYKEMETHTQHIHNQTHT